MVTKWIILRAVPMVLMCTFLLYSPLHDDMNVLMSIVERSEKKVRECAWYKALYTYLRTHLISRWLFDVTRAWNIRFRCFLMAFPPHFHSRFWHSIVTYTLYNISSFVSVQIFSTRCDRSNSSSSHSISGQLCIDCALCAISCMVSTITLKFETFY